MGKILAMEQLNKRGYPLASKCPFCSEAEETLEHLLIYVLKSGEFGLFWAHY